MIDVRDALFENYIYDCVKSGCLGCEREDGESVRYTIVNT